MAELDPKITGFTFDGLIEAIKMGEGQFGKRELARALGLRDGEKKRHLKDALAESGSRRQNHPRQQAQLPCRRDPCLRSPSF